MFLVEHVVVLHRICGPHQVYGLKCHLLFVQRRRFEIAQYFIIGRGRQSSLETLSVSGEYNEVHVFVLVVEQDLVYVRCIAILEVVEHNYHLT